MQRQKNTIDSVPENADINSGSFPLTDGLTQQTYLSNTPDQEGGCTIDSSSSHAVHNGGESFDAWNFPQPRFSLNQGSQPDIDGRKVEEDWSSSFCSSSGAGTSSAPRQLELHHSALFPETAASRNPGDNPNASPSISRLLAWESEHGISTAARFGNSAHSLGSSSHMEGRTGGSSSAMTAWCSSSCKRRAFEGTSGQSNPSASSSRNPQPENFTWVNGTPPTRDSLDPMNLSPSSVWNSPGVNIREHLGPSTRLSVREAALEPFPVPSFMIGSGVSMATGNLDGMGSSSRPQPEPFPINLAAPTLSSLGNLRHSSGSSMPHRPGQSSSFQDMRLTRGTHMNSSASQSTQSSAIQASRLPRTSPSFPWLNPHRSRSGSIPSSLLTGVSRDEVNSGSMHRYMSDTPFSAAAEARNIEQDSLSWDSGAGLTSHGPTGPSSHQASQSYSSRQPLPPFVAHQSMSTDIRRALEMVPWAPEYFDDQNGHLSGLSSSAGPSSGNQGSGSNSSGRRLRYQRAALSVDRQGDELLAMSESPARAFIGNAEGRNRVIAEIRQVLNAMRRGENLRAEDYTLFEPRMFQSLAEMHDRHRDMRLDVDNMSYEELLELGEQIGDVSTGLKEKTILKLLKQHKRQMPAGEETVRDFEPCCICQEQYVDDEDIGELDCGHDFHTDCIKQWLMHKNLCPICKTTGLNT